MKVSSRSSYYTQKGVQNNLLRLSSNQEHGICVHHQNIYSNSMMVKCQLMILWKCYTWVIENITSAYT